MALDAGIVYPPRVGATTPSTDIATRPAGEKKAAGLSPRQDGGLIGSCFVHVVRMQSVAHHTSIVHLTVIPVCEAADVR